MRPEGSFRAVGAPAEVVTDSAPSGGEDPRRIVEWAIIIVGAILVVSAGMSWFTVSEVVFSSGQGTPVHVSVPGLGDASVSVNTGMGQAADAFVASRGKDAFESRGGAPAAPAIVLGLIAAIAGVVYKRSSRRLAAAITSGVAGVIGIVWTLTILVNVRGQFVDAPAAGSYAPAVGLITALVMSFVLTGLAMVATLLEWRVTAAPQPTATVAANNTGPAHPPRPRQQHRRIEGNPAPLIFRASAFAVDLVVIALACGLTWAGLGAVVDAAGSETARHIGTCLAAIAVASIPFGYVFLSEARTGKTLGKRMIGLAVADGAGMLPTSMQSFRRNVAYLLPVPYGIAVGIGATVGSTEIPQVVGIVIELAAIVAVVWMAVTIKPEPTHQGVHDRLANGTRVIHLPGSRHVHSAAGAGTTPLTPWIVGAAAVLVAVVAVAALSESHGRSQAQVEQSAQSTEARGAPATTPTPTPTSSATAAPATTGGGQLAADPFSYERLDPGACADPNYPGGKGVCTVSSPSGNFICSIMASGANCTSPPGEPIVSGVMVPVPGSTERQGEANLISVDAAGQTSLGLITNGRAKATTREQAKASAMPYGHRLSAYGFTCAVDSNAMFCRHDATGNGFTVSREAYRFF